MTILEDRIEIDMADENTKRLDEWFEALERLPVPEDTRSRSSGATGRCTVLTEPKDGDYRCELRVDYGTDVDLTTTPSTSPSRPTSSPATDPFPGRSPLHGAHSKSLACAP